MLSKSPPFKRVWLVFCDHSVVGVWRSRKEAEEAIELRSAGGLFQVEHYLAGPFVHTPPKEKK